VSPITRSHNSWSVVILGGWRKSSRSPSHYRPKETGWKAYPAPPTPRLLSLKPWLPGRGFFSSDDCQLAGR
jgi:hypothetical protein